MISSIIQFILGAGLSAAGLWVATRFDDSEPFYSVKNTTRWLLFWAVLISGVFFFSDLFLFFQGLSALSWILIAGLLLSIVIFSMTHLKRILKYRREHFIFKSSLTESIDNKLREKVDYMAEHTSYRYIEGFLTTEGNIVFMIKMLLFLPLMIIPAFLGFLLYHTYRLIMVQIDQYQAFTLKDFVTEMPESYSEIPFIFLMCFSFFSSFLFVIGQFNEDGEHSVYERFLLVLTWPIAATIVYFITP